MNVMGFPKPTQESAMGIEIPIEIPMGIGIGMGVGMGMGMTWVLRLRTIPMALWRFYVQGEH